MAEQLAALDMQLGCVSTRELLQAWNILENQAGIGNETRNKLKTLLADNSTPLSQRLDEASQLVKEVTGNKAQALPKELLDNIAAADCPVGTRCPQAKPAKKPGSPSSPTTPCDKKKFFDLYSDFKKIANKYNTDVYFLMAQASRESGWAEEVDNYNLFGVNKTPAENKVDPPYKGEDGKLYNTNKKYDSWQHSLSSWANNFGNSIRNVETIDEYANALQNRKPKPYNPRVEAYKVEILENYCSVMGRLKECGLEPSELKFSKGSPYTCEGKKFIKKK